jgi:hypothetical protein
VSARAQSEREGNERLHVAARAVRSKKNAHYEYRATR